MPDPFPPAKASIPTSPTICFLITTTVRPAADLGVSITADTESVQIEGDSSFTITIDNQGPSVSRRTPFFKFPSMLRNSSSLRLWPNLADYRLGWQSVVSLGESEFGNHGQFHGRFPGDVDIWTVFECGCVVGRRRFESVVIMPRPPSNRVSAATDLKCHHHTKPVGSVSRGVAPRLTPCSFTMTVHAMQAESSST